MTIVPLDELKTFTPMKSYAGVPLGEPPRVGVLIVDSGFPYPFTVIEPPYRHHYKTVEEMVCSGWEVD